MIKPDYKENLRKNINRAHKMETLKNIVEGMARAAQYYADYGVIYFRSAPIASKGNFQSAYNVLDYLNLDIEVFVEDGNRGEIKGEFDMVAIEGLREHIEVARRNIRSREANCLDSGRISESERLVRNQQLTCLCEQAGVVI